MVLYERLAARFGEQNVFLDVRHTVRGVDWLEAMESLEVSDLVFIALIGPRWSASVSADHGVTRGLGEPLEEIRIALRRGARVVPVLVDRAAMPAVDELPSSILPIADRVGARLRSTRLDQDIWDLIAALQRRGGDQAAQAPPVEVAGRRGEDLPRLLHRAARGGVVLVGSREAEHAPGITSPAVVSRRPEPEQSAPHTEATAPSWQGEAVQPPMVEPPASSLSPEATQAPARRAPWRRLRGRQSAVWLLAGAATLAVIKWITGFPIAADSAQRTDPPEDDAVECTVFACRSLQRAEPSLVQVFVHPRADSAYAAARAQEADPGTEVRIARYLDCSVAPGARVRVELRVPGAYVEQPFETIVWRGRPEVAQFEVMVSDPRVTGVVATVLIAVDDEPVGRVKFKLAVEETAAVEPQPVGEVARNYRAAFISYASEDRAKVLLWRRMAQRFELKAFQDRLDLEPGERWAKAIEHAIDDSDLFVLFWSHDAKQSTWVRREVKQALQHQSLDDEQLPEIWPVILDGPPPATPWAELSHLHFDDPLLYFTEAWDVEPASSAGIAAGVRFDGVYVQLSEGTVRFIRFFAPNAAVDVTVGADVGQSLAELLPQVVQWLGPGRDYGEGVFGIDGETIAWDSVSSFGTVRYHGTIGVGGAELRLHTHSLITEHKSVGVWRFAGLEGG
jgi:hypothetical protein